MDWWMAGAVLVAGLAWSVWDVSRPGRATGAALLTLRGVAGLALLALAAQALDAGAVAGAAIAASASLPLILGLFRGVIATRESTPARRLPVRVDAAVTERRSDAGHAGHRAA